MCLKSPFVKPNGRNVTVPEKLLRAETITRNIRSWLFSEQKHCWLKFIFQSVWVLGAKKLPVNLNFFKTFLKVLMSNTKLDHAESAIIIFYFNNFILCGLYPILNWNHVKSFLIQKIIILWENGVRFVALWIKQKFFDKQTFFINKVSSELHILRIALL